MRRKVWRTLSHNALWKLLSLVVAFFLWVVVVAQPEVTALQTAPVFYKNLRSDLSLAPGAPEGLRLELRGTSTSLSRANLAEASITLDLAGVDEKRTAPFTVTADKVHMPEGITFVRSMPAQITLKLTPIK
jgi:hypothetical protein